MFGLFRYTMLYATACMNVCFAMRRGKGGGGGGIPLRAECIKRTQSHAYDPVTISHASNFCKPKDSIQN
ncbi:hypothetical protein POVWA2_081860 [Plasmodium ovale wallikeri]|uniref:Uncharacterized protein n=1 Tax=Plasmodium ovale wallikeri TaxID=864142 RepID=A0A1A9AME6_PLAOA|nr:hypothetical protein POVWA1_052170 [Plasmodium ovale wallikeri]SBT57833.1 hypothetical protein POVWA2_081860 [Plasmodium ovale wallikeri]